MIPPHPPILKSGFRRPAWNLGVENFLNFPRSAATAEFEGIALWHTDTVLKKLTGFPQRYFVNAA